MKKLLLYSIIAASIFTSTQTLQAQTAPAKQWDRTFGGSKNDYLYYNIQTADGGYLLGGKSFSGINGDKTQANQGPINTGDYWVLKLDANGNKIWDKTFGGSGEDQLSFVQQTQDGGYLLAGGSTSGISNDKSEASKGDQDIWLIKLDSNGIKTWDKTIGGSGYDGISSFDQTADGGFILGATSNSPISGDKSAPSKGYFDMWLVKLDGNGVKQWDKTIGGSDSESIRSVHQNPDGSFILGGQSTSPVSGDKTEPSRGWADFWVVKVDVNGNKLWDKTIGGNDQDYIRALELASNGDYIVAGETRSTISGEKSEASKGLSDYWVVRIDSNGSKIWDKTIGGSLYESLSRVIYTSDGGFLLGGSSSSGVSGDKSVSNKGGWDYWVVKLDANGSKLWDQTYGGTTSDYLNTMQQTQDGGFILGGSSDSGVSGDKSQPSQGEDDYWFIKLAPEIVGLPETQSTSLTLYPNPTTGLINLEIKDQQPTQISVYNSLGQTILTKTETQPNADGKLQLDLSNQAKGIYTVQVISGNQSAVKKVVLQ